MNGDLPCLSIRQPWAWMILHAGKDIENRNWPTRYRGRIRIHAAQGMTRPEYVAALEFVAASVDPRMAMPPLRSLQRGGIVGEVDIVDCVTVSESPWFVGRYGFVLRSPTTCPFVPCKGALGFFKP